MAKDLKTVKKGDTVIMKGFTGMKLGVFPVVAVTEKAITIQKKDGSKVKFGIKSGKQMGVEEGKERYANSVMVDDGSYVAPDRSKGGNKKTKAKKATPAKAEPEDDYEDEDEDDEEEEVEEKPAKPKKKGKKKAKAKAKAEPEDDEEDDAEYEEVE